MAIQKINQTLPSQKQKFSVVLQAPKMQELIANTLTDPARKGRFVASVSSAVANNPALQNCDAGTVICAALLGESLELSPSAQLGQFYMVPFNDTRNNRTTAQFILGYKGYIQLAIRSGQYKKINVCAIKEGELNYWNALEEEISVQLIDDDTVREKAKTIGYYAMFEYTNGFKKCLYWSKEKMEKHALDYSKGYASKKGYTFWEKDFDSMALKTMLRQLIGKWGVMSIQFQKAFEADERTLQNADNNEINVIDELPADEIDNNATGIKETSVSANSDEEAVVYDAQVNEEGDPL